MLRSNSRKIAGLRSPEFLSGNEYGKAALQTGDFALCGIINEYCSGFAGGTRPRRPGCGLSHGGKARNKAHIAPQLSQWQPVLALLVPSNLIIPRKLPSVND